MMDSETKTDEFEVSWNEKKYVCKKMGFEDVVVYAIEFTQRPLYLSKATDAKGEAFWVSIPPDTKLSRVIREIGAQIDEHNKK